jgi:murein DD-endopeptidase MepM/ murein hydrolase activator NlpD
MMGRAGTLVVAAALLAVAALLWLKLEWSAPQVSLASPLEALGRETPLEIDVQVGAPGLRAVWLRLQAGDTTFDLGRQEYAATSWRGSGIKRQQVRLQPDLAALRLPEGPATLEVFVDTYAWHLLRSAAEPALSLPVTIDLTPPTAELLTTQHNARLGGVTLLVFRQGADTVRSGVNVGPYFFPAVTGLFEDPHVAVVFFAIPQDLSGDIRPQLELRDAAGNRREVQVPALIKPRRFAERTLVIDDEFLARKVPEIERENRLPPSTDLLQGYLHINRQLRQESEAKIREMTAEPFPQPLWDGPFHRQRNAAPLSAFADRRTYEYKGEAVDQQTHLGYDLASLRNSPVEAAQNGIVVYADNLGIYGNTVILDHGLGIFSLYGHLSTIAVQPGERVTKAQTLGQTGETGLAGGDHLHFSVMLRGLHVDPVEWWDPAWIRDHVTKKLQILPRAAAKDDLEHAES